MRILICPLDWGLGHAARCVPVIHEFLKRKDEVFLASSGSALQFLQLEFPDLTIFELPGYQPTYSENGLRTRDIIRQLSGFKQVIRLEHKIIRQLDGQYQFDLIISDNRYGCWSRKEHSVIMTHQTQPVLPRRLSWFTSIFHTLLSMYLKRFIQIWIPDHPHSGITTPFNGRLKQKHSYIGWISRFIKRENVPIQYKVLAMVSGPEPQRSIFKKIMIDQLMSSGLKSLLVSGDPGNVYREEMGMLTVVNHLASGQMEEAVQSSELVVSRSGYSTIMDLIALGKKAILIPTPGQTEQEILADYFMKEKVAYSMGQEKFSLTEAIESSGNYSGFSKFKIDQSLLINAIAPYRV